MTTDTTSSTDFAHRIVHEQGVAARVAGIIEDSLEHMGFRLVRVKLSSQNGATLQIMAERPDGSFTISDCEQVSKLISPLLDVEEPISSAYRLEVSSPGIDRPLVRATDFVDWAGFDCKIDLSHIVQSRKRLRGILKGADLKNGHAIITIDATHGETVDFEVPFNAIADARLILTDALIQEALKRNKTLIVDEDDVGEDVEIQIEKP